MTLTRQSTDNQPDVSRPGRAGRRRRRPLVRFLPPVTLLAVLTITASSEYELARTVLDLHPAIAWALPVAIDSYVLAALRSGRDVAAALTVMGGALATAMGAHLLDAQHSALPAPVLAPVATAIMVILVVVAWRVHVLIEHPTAPGVPDTPPGEYTPATNEVAPEVHSHAYSLPAVSGATSRGQCTGALAAPDGAGTAGVRALPRPTPAVSEYPDPGTAAPDQPDQLGEGQRLSDEQILTELLAKHPVEAPSIRALMRTYGIGQTRASRLRNHALTQTSPTTTTSTSSHDQDHQNPPPEDQNEPHQESHEQYRKSQIKNSDQEPQQESEGMQNEESHPGITDRVGQSRSTSRDSSTAYEANSGTASSRTATGPAVDPGGTALLFPEWEAELAAGQAVDEPIESADQAAAAVVRQGRGA